MPPSRPRRRQSAAAMTRRGTRCPNSRAPSANPRSGTAVGAPATSTAGLSTTTTGSRSTTSRAACSSAFSHSMPTTTTGALQPVSSPEHPVQPRHAQQDDRRARHETPERVDPSVSDSNALAGRAKKLSSAAGWHLMKEGTNHEPNFAVRNCCSGVWRFESGRFGSGHRNRPGRFSMASLPEREVRRLLELVPTRSHVLSIRPGDFRDVGHEHLPLLLR